MEDCIPTACKEMERIETLVDEAQKETYDVCNTLKGIMEERIYSGNPIKMIAEDLKEPVQTNKIDRIITELHRIINTLREFRKQNLANLEKELIKL